MKNIFKAIGWTFLNFILQFAVMLPFGIAYVANGITDDTILNQKISENTFIFTIISNAIIVAIALLACKIKKKRVSEEWKLFTRSPKNYFFSCIKVSAKSSSSNILQTAFARASTSISLRSS